MAVAEAEAEAEAGAEAGAETWAGPGLCSDAGGIKLLSNIAFAIAAVVCTFAIAGSNGYHVTHCSATVHPSA